MNETVKKQIVSLQSAIWNLEKAKDDIQFDIGESTLGKHYVENIAEMIESIEDDMNNLWENME